MASLDQRIASVVTRIKGIATAQGSSEDVHIIGQFIALVVDLELKVRESLNATYDPVREYEWSKCVIKQYFTSDDSTIDALMGCIVDEYGAPGGAHVKLSDVLAMF
jgi:hypothetical protein